MEATQINQALNILSKHVPPAPPELVEKNGPHRQRPEQTESRRSKHKQPRTKRCRTFGTCQTQQKNTVSRHKEAKNKRKVDNYARQNDSTKT